MTRCTLAEIRAGMGPNTTVWGGIPSVVLLDDFLSEDDFEQYMDQLFSSIGCGDRLILGVSDNVPPNANMDRLASIKQTDVEAFGPVSCL